MNIFLWMPASIHLSTKLHKPDIILFLRGFTALGWICRCISKFTGTPSTNSLSPTEYIGHIQHSECSLVTRQLSSDNLQNDGCTSRFYFSDITRQSCLPVNIITMAAKPWCMSTFAGTLLSNFLVIPKSCNFSKYLIFYHEHFSLDARQHSFINKIT